MPKSHTEIKQEIVEQIAASASLGNNVRDVRMDVERFSESMLDLVQLERMRARLQTDTQKLHFQSGRDFERERICAFLEALAHNQTPERVNFINALTREIRAGGHVEEGER